ncbi:Major Facilitator Superfamily protein [Lentzea fradiae]|uniref:Major Facilitator Superfamily protein n=1 Tax=Lentzea fradiae TaxID=200378 RepID=A0A1G7KW15_9PSEU|nr:MFS transporter [Lentzea fradiae]SDF41405.1 Major Facilitator Superfamily protein [Lentzea fradiae]
MTASVTASAHTAATGGQHRGLALTVLLIPAALTLLSVTSVNVALPSIRAALGASAVQQSLVLTTYALAFAIVLLFAGRLGDQYGHKKVYLAGVAIFTLASTWCGLAADPGQLVAARVLAGIGGGLAMTPVTALIQLLYKGPERARPFGIMGAVFGASSAAGPILAGLLLHSGGDFGWRLTFLVNVPFGLLAGLFALKALPSAAPAGVRGNDPVGLLLFTAGLIGTILPFSLGQGITALSLAVLAAGVVLFVLFARWELRREQRGEFAVVPLRLFRQRALPIGVVTTFLGFAGFTASFLMLALMWQDALGHDGLSAGLLVLPFALGSVASAVFTQRLTRRFGTKVVTAGLTLIAAGLAVVGLLVLVVAPENQTILVMLVPLLVTGAGVGLFVGPNTNASFAQTEGRDAGVASALVTAAQRAGTAVGIGILSAIYAAADITSLTTQAVAAFMTAAFAGLAALVMVVTRRSSLGASGHR